ncbi:hypothetical protein O3661_09740 [Neisseria sp. 20925_1_37]
MEGFVAHFVFQTTEYVQAAEDASGIEAGGQLGTTADLPVELFEFEIVVPVDINGLPRGSTKRLYTPVN